MIVDETTEKDPINEGENSNLPAVKIYEIPEDQVIRLTLAIKELTRQNAELKDDLASCLTFSYFMGKMFNPSAIMTTAAFLIRLAKNPKDFKEILKPFHEVMQKHPDVMGEIEKRTQELIKNSKIKM